MSFPNVPMGPVDNPINKSPYNKSWNITYVAPGNDLFVTTDDGLYMTTDDAFFVTTD